MRKALKIKAFKKDLGRKYVMDFSARHSHCRGQGFDSPMLHNETGSPSRWSCFVMRARSVRILTEDNAKHWRGERGKRQPGGLSGAAGSVPSESTETSNASAPGEQCDD